MECHHQKNTSRTSGLWYGLARCSGQTPSPLLWFLLAVTMHLGFMGAKCPTQPCGMHFGIWAVVHRGPHLDYQLPFQSPHNTEGPCPGLATKLPAISTPPFSDHQKLLQSVPCLVSSPSHLHIHHHYHILFLSFSGTSFPPGVPRPQDLGQKSRVPFVSLPLRPTAV